jgi:enoyl-CoA hydratase
MRHDRRSAIEQWGLPGLAAMQNEFQLGAQTLESGESTAGARRFQGGAGRNASFD